MEPLTALDDCGVRDDRKWAFARIVNGRLVASRSMNARGLIVDRE